MDPTQDATEDASQPPASAGARTLRTLTVVHPTIEPPRVLDVGAALVGRDPGPGGLELVDSRRASRRHARLTVSEGALACAVADLGSRNGTTVDGVPVGPVAVPVRPGAVLRFGDTLAVYDAVDLAPGFPDPALTLGSSPARARAEALADRVAPTLLPVLIHGPTGAGKERLSQRIHARSGRGGKLVPVNCGAISGTLVASELFGHVRGAFSGAGTSRPGLFVAAEKGTLFLDEIGELPLDLQPNLLRAIQENRIRPVGSDRDKPVDVRYVTATHRDLRRLEAEGRFRADLYARLAGLTIALPGLCDRRGEILPLFRQFLGEGPGGGLPPLSTGAAEALLRHDWPHNVRELKFAAEQIRLFAGGLQAIPVELLPESVRRRPAPPLAEVAPEMAPEPAPAGRSDAPDRETLEALLQTHGGNVARVARALGKHRQQVYRWLRARRLDPAAFRADD